MRLVEEWNALYPEFPVAFTDISRRAEERVKAATIPRTERIITRGPKALRREQFLPSGPLGPPPLTDGQRQQLRGKFPDLFQER